MKNRNTETENSFFGRLLLVVGLSVAVIGLAGVTPARAQEGFRELNADDPISFTADRLEIKREGRVAAFIGNVEAVQGDLNLKADIVRVYYQGKSVGDDPDNSSGFGGAVSRIDTSGNVQITSRGDVALGDWAIYDLGRRIVTMGGAVTLTRGDAVIKGSRLELDLETGKSSIQSTRSGSGATRVRGEFTPATESKSE